ALANRLVELEQYPSSRVGEALEVDLKFHTLIFTASHNEMFVALAPSLLSILKGKSVFGSQKCNPIGNTAALHVELAESIAAVNHVDAQNMSRRVLLDIRDETEQSYREPRLKHHKARGSSATCEATSGFWLREPSLAPQLPISGELQARVNSSIKACRIRSLQSRFRPAPSDANGCSTRS